MTTIRGHAFPARQTRKLDAELRVSGGAAEVVGADGVRLSHCLLSELKFDPQLGRQPRRTTLPDGTLFETEDHAAVATLTGRDAGGILHRLEAFHPRLFLILGGCIFGVWLIWRFGLDLLAAAAVALTPPPVVGAIDAGILKSLDVAIAVPSTLKPAERARVEAVLDRLLAQLDPAERQAYVFHLEYRALPGLGPNAVALPNGTMIVTDEIVRLFPSDDVLAGVLGHEIGHVVEAHGLTQLYRSLGIAVLVALLLGDTGPVVEDVVLEGNVVLSLAYSRRNEAAADAFGVQLSRRVGYDPKGLIDFFDYVSREFGDDASWLSSHPAPADRIEEIRRQIAD